MDYGFNNMMSGYWNPFGLGVFGMGFMMIIFWGLVIWLIYFLIKSTTSGTTRVKDENSLEIAKKRFAKGDITKKEFEEIKKKLK